MLQFDGVEVKFLRSKLLWVLLAVLLLIGSLPFLLPSSIYQKLIEDRLESSTGLDFDLSRGFSVALLPSIKVQAESVDISGNIALGVEVIGTIPKFDLEMDFLEFISGNFHVNKLLVQHPDLTVTGDFTPFVPDWIRSNLSTARKEDIRYLEILMHFIEDSVFDQMQIQEGIFVWQKNSNEKLTAQKLLLSIEKPEGGKDFVATGNVYINDRSVDISMRLQRPDEFIRGFRSKLALLVDSALLRVEFKGTGAHRRSFIAQGNLNVQIPSNVDFCTWLNPIEECLDRPAKISINSDLKLRDQKLQIEDAVFRNGDFEFTNNLGIDFKTVIPTLKGTILVPPRPFKDIGISFEKFQRIDFENYFLDTFNANLDIKYQGLSLQSAGEAISPDLKVVLDKGHLTVTSSQFEILGGLSNLRFRWHKGDREGYADLRLDMSSLDLKKVQDALNRDFEMTGTLKLALEVQGEGGKLEQILESAKITGDFSVLDGVLLNSDVANSLNGEDLMQFEFAEITSKVKGDNGQVNAENISFVAPFVTVKGAATYNITNDNLKIHLNSNIPERKSPTGEVLYDAQQGFVTIKGPLDKLVLVSSVNGEEKVIKEEGLHSGLIPNTEEKPSVGENDQITIQETDLFD